MTTPSSNSEQDKRIIPGPGDSADYETLMLDNGLQVLLVHDDKAERAGAAMNVATGSAFNPERFPGLAHFLEHMLFLGTDHYPDPNDYQQFLSAHGGHHNAFTAPRDTNYFFDITPEAFAPALTRFSRFFIAPTLDEAYVERERHAVNAEYQARLQDDGRRIEDALSQSLNPEHPYNHFSIGNLDTLKDHPDQALRDALVTFHETHYDANTMSLVLIGPQSLDELSSLARELFSDVPDRGLTRRTIDQPLILDDQLPMAMAAQSLDQQHQVRFLFPIPDPEQDYRLKPVSYLSHMIGHEAPGSLLACLRQRGWADGLSAGSARGDGQRALLMVNIELTPQGSEHLDEIQAALMAWIGLIRDQGVESWRYDEQARVVEQQFRFQQRQAPAQLATALSVAMARYPIQEVRRAGFLMEGFNAARIHDYLGALTPDRLLRLYTGPGVTGEQCSPWFGTPWQYVPMHHDRIETALEGLALPQPNAFIARDLKLINEGSNATRCILDAPGLDLWLHATGVFGAPRVEWRISLQSPQAGQSARQSVLTELLARWLEDSLSDVLYPARLAGQGMSAYAHARGMTLSFSGWRDRQVLVMTQVIDQLMHAEMESHHLQRVSRSLKRRWQDEPGSALHEQLNRTLVQALVTPGWTSEARLAALEEITPEAVRAFRDQWLSELHIQALATGDTGTELAQEIGEALSARLSPRVTPEAIPDLSVLTPTATPPLLRPRSRRGDSGVLYYLQGEGRSLEDQARLAILGQMISAPFFNQLRTDQQLGYVVSARYQPLLDAPGLALLVQSPDHDTSVLNSRIEQFLEGFDELVMDMGEEDVVAYQQAVAERLVEREQRLGQITARLWQELAHGWTDFDRREQLAAAVSAQRSEEIRAAWQALRSRPVLITGADDGVASNLMDAPWQPFLMLAS
ncbi:insulinase family protein [Kushneria marisflavi]|uniref:Protease 3 n=1 Tax=Kushneria marisflavi TaxID=157779 RepID=A0A240UQD3_9GAMM|nr:insulinase family protein [Kushneria marisflavi]ART63694.1 peptidase M16 [Kushneria marisflavi]RKD85373.1 secreted Zn-dependent insulinase-like peptidase [Kushneria marisflavi]